MDSCFISCAIIYYCIYFDFQDCLRFSMWEPFKLVPVFIDMFPSFFEHIHTFWHNKIL